MTATISKRYSEADLAEFKALIEAKLEKEMKKLKRLENALKDINEALTEEGDWADDTSGRSDLAMYQGLVYRQRKHINDYQNALQRIHNKSYGICTVTGELIDKRRLLAVPITTKSIAGKMVGEAMNTTKNVEDERPKPAPKQKSEPVIFSRIIKKTSPIAVKTDEDFEEDEEELDNDLGEEYGDMDTLGKASSEEIDFDSIADESGEEDF